METERLKCVSDFYVKSEAEAEVILVNFSFGGNTLQ